MLLSRLKSVIKTPTVEFLCLPEDVGVIPPPYPARKHMPDWYKKLPPRVEGRTVLNNGTVKRCAPFLDAMSIGWIIPLAADVEFITNADASGVTYQWTFPRPMVENHNPLQLVGHHELPKPPMKFLNHWLIRCPKDYSLLFMPPLNRPDSRFECASGVVDADRYFEFINFPFFFKEPNFTGILKQGTPLVQVVPLHRSLLKCDHEIDVIDKETWGEVEKTRRQRGAHESIYRDERWVRK
jgi:hypothetical protein